VSEGLETVKIAKGLETAALFLVAEPSSFFSFAIFFFFLDRLDTVPFKLFRILFFPYFGIMNLR